MSTAKPMLVIRPSSGWGALNLRELWQFRELLFTLAGRDLKLRYKQTALGVIWVVLQPLLAAGILSFVFGTIAGFSNDKNPYFLITYTGSLGWNYFSNLLSRNSGSLLGNTHLISKVFFPRLLLPFSNVPSTLIDFAIALAVMFVVMIWYQTPLHFGILLLPVWLILLSMLAMGIGIFAASLAVSYRDINYIMPVFIQIMMFISPVPYSVEKIAEKIPAQYMVWYYLLNPVSSLIQAFRVSFLGPTVASPPAYALAYSACFSVIIFVLGILSFKRMERRFADVI